MTENTDLSNQNLKVTRFSPEKCEAADIETVAMFDDRLNLSCLRVLKIAKLAKKKRIYSTRSIGAMCGISHVAASFALKKLVEYGYLVHQNNNYYINTGFILKDENDDLMLSNVNTESSQVLNKVNTECKASLTEVLSKLNNNIYNNTNKNINKYIPTLASDICDEKQEEIKPNVDTSSVMTGNVSTELQQLEELKSPLILPSKEKSKYFFLTAKEKERVVARYRAELGELNFKKYLPLALEWAERYYEDHPRKKFKSPTRVLMDWPLSKAKQEMMLDMKLAKEKQR